MEPCVRHVMFLQQMRLVGALCQSCSIFAPKEVDWGPMSVTSCFCTKAGRLQNEVAEILKSCCRNTEVLLLKSLNSGVQPIWFSSAFAIDMSGYAHSRHGVLNLDHHWQELSQHPPWYIVKPHDTIQTLSTIDQQYPIHIQRDVENTRKCTRLTVSLPHDPARSCRP